MLCLNYDCLCWTIYNIISFSLHAAPALDDANFAAKLVNVRNWWNLGVALLVLWNKLDEIERVYTTVEDRLKAIFAYFKHMHPYANWRCVIWGLDECGDTQLANNIRSYAEPIAGIKFDFVVRQ